MCNKITEIIINGAVGTAPLSILIKNTIKSVMSGGGFVTHDQFKKAADYWKNKKQNAMPDERLKKQYWNILVPTILVHLRLELGIM